MTTYNVSLSDAAGEPIGSFDAETHEAAALMAVRKITRNHNAVARRVTGDIGKSGCFQGYHPWPQGTLNSTGPQIHVMEE
jgi:hypothetical protein